MPKKKRTNQGKEKKSTDPNDFLKEESEHLRSASSGASLVISRTRHRIAKWRNCKRFFFLNDLWNDRVPEIISHHQLHRVIATSYQKKIHRNIFILCFFFEVFTLKLSFDFVAFGFVNIFAVHGKQNGRRIARQKRRRGGGLAGKRGCVRKDTARQKNSIFRNKSIEPTR